MATSKSDIYQIQNLDVSTKADIGDFIGRVRSLFINFTFPAASDVNAIADVIKLCKIPKGARVIDYHLAIPSLGTTGIANIGWAASVDGVEVADADGFAGTALDAGGQAVDSRLSAAAAGFCKRFAAEVDMQLALTEATDNAGDVNIKGVLHYVID